MTTEIITSNVTGLERPWWTVRSSLIATLGLLIVVLIALLAPTPLNAWVFGGDSFCQLASR